MRVTAGERGLRVLDAASTACCERSNPTLQVLCCALCYATVPWSLDCRPAITICITVTVAVIIIMHRPTRPLPAALFPDK